MVTIGTHSGAFQCDEALGCWMLKCLPKYASAPIVRSRDPKVLEPLEIVIDVGGIYEHGKLRYDHHQRGFFETFDGAVGVATGPENATGKYKTKLSASGLVYKHYGREIIASLHPTLKASPDELEWVFQKMYKDFMEGIDANDNGIEVADEVRYKEGTSLPLRVARLNSRWNTPPGGPTEDERFAKASALCGEEFSAVLDYIATCELPARTAVRQPTPLARSPGRHRSRSLLALTHLILCCACVRCPGGRGARGIQAGAPIRGGAQVFERRPSVEDSPV